MQEQAELGPPSVAVKTAVTSSSVLALISVVCEILTRYRVDPSGGIVAVIRPTDGNIDAASDRPSVEDRPIFLSHAKSFDFLWSSQILVVITCISLAGYGRWDFAVALGIHQTLFQRLHLVKKWEPGRRKLWHAAACSGLVLGLLIVSVFLAERGREPKAAGDFWMPDRAGKYLPLSVVTLVHVWISLPSYPEIQGDINLACAGADSTVALVNESLLVASSLHRKCGVGPDGSGAGSEPAE
ncbi:hypothetical protein N657DRAFT_638074 [Parathielavia appendiculata]|uniref:Uncharacterized protein n=1 Tax=Parathielavia appendiculata TaxID=2587402 RepID=A0AAN6YYH8_9PEZI|nr:hypothetical protein N657DRAFT_638074 [Parathielavia appendiculata]